MYHIHGLMTLKSISHQYFYNHNYIFTIFWRGKQLTDFFLSYLWYERSSVIYQFPLLTCDQNTFCHFMMLSHSALYFMNTKYLFTQPYHKIEFGTYCLRLKITFSSLMFFLMPDVFEYFMWSDWQYWDVAKMNWVYSCI